MSRKVHFYVNLGAVSEERAKGPIKMSGIDTYRPDDGGSTHL
jgi:hypothetical protein